MELVSDIRPKFPENVETHACGEGIATYAQGGSNPAFVPRMVGVIESDRGRSSQLLRKIEHVLAAVALRHESMFDCMEETLPTAGVDQTVIPRVLREDRWIRKIREKPPRCLPGEVGAKTSPITIGPVRTWGPGLTLDPNRR